MDEDNIRFLKLSVLALETGQTALSKVTELFLKREHKSFPDVLKDEKIKHDLSYNCANRRCQHKDCPVTKFGNSCTKYQWDNLYKRKRITYCSEDCACSFVPQQRATLFNLDLSLSVIILLTIFKERFSEEDINQLSELRKCRNIIAHKRNAKFTESEYLELWAKVEKSISAVALKHSPVLHEELIDEMARLREQTVFITNHRLHQKSRELILRQLDSVLKYAVTVSFRKRDQEDGDGTPKLEIGEVKKSSDIPDGIIDNIVIKFTMSQMETSFARKLEQTLNDFIKDNPGVIEFSGMEFEHLEKGSVVIQLRSTEERSYAEVLEYPNGKEFNNMMETIFSNLGVDENIILDVSFVVEGFTLMEDALDEIAMETREHPVSQTFKGKNYPAEKSDILTPVELPSSHSSFFVPSEVTSEMSAPSEVNVLTAESMEKSTVSPSGSQGSTSGGSDFIPQGEEPFIDSQRSTSGGSDFIAQDNQPFVEQEDEDIDRSDVCFLLVGKTGTGKSSTGNMILGKEVFYSSVSAAPVTTKCDSHSAWHEQYKRTVTVVDTPGPFGSEKENENMDDIFVEAVSLSSPGFHVIVLVLNNERFRREDQETLDFYVNFFGEKLYRHLIIAFTHRDVIEETRPFQDFLQTLTNKTFNSLKRNSQNRVICFDNKTKQRKGEQLNELFTITQDILDQNNGQCFIHPLYESVEVIIIDRRNSLRKSKRKNMAQSAVKGLTKKYPNETLKQIQMRICNGKKVDRFDRLFSSSCANLVNDALSIVEKEVDSEIKQEITGHKGIWQILKEKVYSFVGKRSAKKVKPLQKT